jgi:AmmeMemoRadiSam system protein B
MFYPADPGELRRMVEHLVQGEGGRPGPPAQAYVLPHAGYIYSGPTAGSGYRCLQAERDRVHRVILLGPSHRTSFEGLAYSSHDAFATPLGLVPVDRDAIDLIRDLPQVVELDAAHRQEHSLEVHLPFLQVVLGTFTLVPLVVGDASDQDVSEVLERLWMGTGTRVIVSSDLSHYHSYRSACAIDRETAETIEQLEPVGTDQACGAVPLDGLLLSARKRGLRMSTLDLRNSGDTAGPRDRVVGYGAFAAV